MNFIKLTRAGGEEVLANPAHIVHIEPSDTGSRVLFSVPSLATNTNLCIEVRETPEEILRSLKEI